MKITNLSFEKINQLSSRDKAYQLSDERLSGFYSHIPEIESFPEVIKLKSRQSIDRLLLSNTISETYKDIEISSRVKQNIELLKEVNTYTITTAHQPSLMTGPLYFVYKICSVINLCKRLKSNYPEYNFVPLFVSGGEDHDFEEINHFNIYSKTINWNYDHKGEPTGHLPLDGFDSILSELDEVLRSDSAARNLLNEIGQFIKSSETYADLTHRIVNQIFGSYGLVFVNMDREAYKNAFKGFIKKEILESISKSFVVDQQAELKKVGFDSQAHAREINFFYFSDDGRRLRIERTNDRYKILDTDLEFSESEMTNLIEQSPGRFSPNVIMRPIYQEYILPNLAYVGGGGELAYWLERATQFEAFQLPYPMLIRRNSVLLVDHGSKRMLNKLDLNVMDLFKDKNIVINSFLEQSSGDEFSLSNAENQITEIFKEISEKFTSLDKSMIPRVESEKVKTIKTINALESKLKKVIKQRAENDLNKIEKLYSRLMPKGNLQERKRNILEFLDQYDLDLITKLVAELDPLDKHFKIIDLTE